MEESYCPPLAVNFVWNLSDQESVWPIIEALKASFARDENRPFSRGLSIPLFLFSSLNSFTPPKEKPVRIARSNLVFVFTSVNTLGNKAWREYVESLPQGCAFHIVPVAVDTNGLAHGGNLRGLNCIRMYDWPKENKDLHERVFLSHEIYRFGLRFINPGQRGKCSSITIFLSHAKAGDTGRLHSERIKKFIDNTNMSRFFDANEISPGYMFNEEIEKNIKDSTLVAIESDAYSSRYWCQREILLAKKHNRPIVVVNCLEEFEDRIFPAASNVPCVHVESSGFICDKDILRILSATIIETIRFGYSMACLESYKAAGWLKDDCALIARPPEIRQVIELRKSGVKKICYPEPPIYSEEADWHKYMGVEAFTPLWNQSEKNCLSKARIGLSISEFQTSGYSNHHIPSECLLGLSQDLARHLLARSGTLIYGGDLRPGGFTEFILDESRILKERVRDTKAHVENHLAWPLYLSEPEVTSWRAKYNDVMETVEHKMPEDVDGEADRDNFLPPSSPTNLYIWSRCLTEMRSSSVGSSSARVCAGGRVSGYKGRMPGVLEEIMIALDKDVPVFLLGGFGGVVKDVCDVIDSGKSPDSFAMEWQIAHTEGYSEFAKIAEARGFAIDYSKILSTLRNLKLADLAYSCRLDESEYFRLMNSSLIDECVHLVLKGLREINK